MSLTLSPPEYVTWLLTTKCNLRCEHCYVSSRSWGSELGRERVLKLVEEACEIGVKNLHLTGGEPLLRKDILEILGAAKNGISVSLFTNLSAITRDMARRLSSLGIHVFTSMEGAIKNTHEAVRGPGAWGILMRSIRVLREEGVGFTPIFSISRLNASEAGDFVRLAEKLGASSAVLLPVMPFGRAADKDWHADAYSCVKALRLAGEAADGLGFHITLWCMPFASLIVSSPYVSWDSCRIERNMDIGPGGEVLLCDTLDIIVSDVKGKSLSEAWRELRSSRVLKEILKSNPCPDCSLSETCRGGCYARSYRLYRVFNNPDPLCPKILESSIAC
ncbi:MAG: radical SAM protein [Crenarchaeota archaeon]|nr:radical SAM protein [Thermoproteota archaeon]